MRKLLVFFGSIFLGQVCYSATANDLTVMGKVVTNRMDVSTIGKVAVIGFIDGSSQTTAFTGISGGGGGGGGAIYNGSSSVGFSTVSFPGATITSGGGASTVTYMPAILSTWTQVQAYVNFRSTTDSSLTSFVNFRSTTDSSLTTFVNFLTTGNVAFNNFTSTAQALGISTANIQTLLTAHMSTSDSRGNTFVNFRSTTDTSLTTFVNFRSTTDTSLTNFVNFRSTSDTLFNTLITTMMAIRTSTGNIESTLAQRTIVGFNNGTPLGVNLTAINVTGSGGSASISGSTMTVTITAGSGGGGGGSGSVYNGSNVVGVSTFAFPGATITSDGNMGSTVTYMPAILSTWTQVQAYVNFRSTTDTQMTTWQNFSASADLRDLNFLTFESSSDAQQTKFVNFRSTTDTSLTSFVNFFSTANSKWENHKSTSDAYVTNILTWLSTASTAMDGKLPNNAGVIRSTHIASYMTFVNPTFSSATVTSSMTVMDVITSTKGMLAPSATFYEMSVGGSSVNFNNHGFALVFASAPDTTANNNHLIWTRVSNGNYLIGSGGDNAGTAGGGVSGGAGFWWRTTGGMSVVGTVTVIGNQVNTLVTDGVGASTWTIGTSTLPYIWMPIQAGSLKGRPNKYGASDTNSQLAITTNPTTAPDADNVIQMDYVSFAASTRQFAGFQFSLSSPGVNGWMVGSTMSWAYTGSISSGGAAGAQCQMCMRLACAGGNANLQSLPWGSSVCVNLPNMATNWVEYKSTPSASITPGGTCFGNSPIYGQIFRNSQDGSDNLGGTGGTSGSFFNLDNAGLWYRKSSMTDDDRWAR